MKWKEGNTRVEFDDAKASPSELEADGLGAGRGSRRRERLHQRDRIPRLRMDAGYRGGCKEWAEEALDLEFEIVNRSPKPPPEKALSIRASEWFKEGRGTDLSKLPKHPAF